MPAAQRVGCVDQVSSQKVVHGCYDFGAFGRLKCRCGRSLFRKINLPEKYQRHGETHYSNRCNTNKPSAAIPRTVQRLLRRKRSCCGLPLCDACSMPRLQLSQSSSQYGRITESPVGLLITARGDVVAQQLIVDVALPARRRTQSQ